MNIHTLAAGTEKSRLRRSRRFAELWLVPGMLILTWSASVAADTTPGTQSSQQNPAEQGAEVIVSLPTSTGMAMALATPGLRNEALLDLAAAKNVLSYAKQNNEADSAVLAQKFLDDRGWLARLVERYGWIQPRSAVLDPAAWLVLEELQQHELRVMSLEYPDQTPQAALVYQVFQRAGERLAAANLPSSGQSADTIAQA